LLGDVEGLAIVALFALKRQLIIGFADVLLHDGHEGLPRRENMDAHPPVLTSSLQDPNVSP